MTASYGLNIELKIIFSLSKLNKRGNLVNLTNNGVILGSNLNKSYKFGFVTHSIIKSSP